MAVGSLYDYECAIKCIADDRQKCKNGLPAFSNRLLGMEDCIIFISILMPLQKMMH